jgi:hypothetical protein
MKKILPILLLFATAFQLFFTSSAFAQNQSATNTVSDSVSAEAGTTTTPSEDTWVNDSDVTFVGKVGARSGQFLDWTLANYSWSYVTAGKQNPLAAFWAQIRNIVYAFFAVFVLITAFIMITTRGRNITVMRFVPRFILIILLVTFSFALIQFIYQITDIIQGFFLKNPAGAGFISQQNLLNIKFNYEDFLGYRVFGAKYDESAFVSILLVKLTAATYYVMSGILLIRKIILWFFIIISPIFPLLLLYAPIRNTGKVWVGEFFRWLLYAPIFAIFLSGLVYVWRAGIPLQFAFSKAVVYPTAINILLGGPGQTLSLANSVNNKESFALYIVALLMLWVIIILPFLLLQIFLDYLKTVSLKENSMIKQLLESGSSFMSKPPPPAPGGTPPSSHQPSGMARKIPFGSKISIPEIRAQSINANMANLRSMQSDVVKLTNLGLPTMRDIAKFETASLGSNMDKRAELAKYHETLEKIADPKKITSPVDRQKFTTIKDKLVQEGQKGNNFANSVLTAANAVGKPEAVIETQKETLRLSTAMQKLSNPDSANIAERQKLLEIKEELKKAQASGDPLAASVMDAMQKGGADESLKEKLKEAKDKGNSIASMVLMQAGLTDISDLSAGPFPVINRVQQVSLDDYESVRKMWEENYQHLEPPKQQERSEWISNDINKITEAINLLVSTDPQNVKKGMESVGNILPFLLIGGFSQTEVVAYLKAKMEAAKSVVGKLKQTQEEEDTMLGVKEKKTEQAKEMSESAQAEIPEEPGLKDLN